MSFISETFDPASALSGQINTQLPINGKFIAWNESIVGITFTFSDGSTQYCPADAAAVFSLPTATPLVSWSQKNVLVSAVGPLSECSIISYYPNEKIVGTYPISLGRITSVGNPIPLTTSATSIVNTGNPVGTPIVTGQVLGDGNNAAVLTNDAQLTLGDGLHHGSLTVTNTAVIDAAGLYVSSGVSKFDNALAGTDGAGNFGANTVSTNTVNAGVVNVGTIGAGTTNTTFINTETITVNTVLNLLKGTIKRIVKFTGITVAGVVHVNPAMGQTPDLVFVTFNVNSTPGPHTIAPNYATLSATNIDVWSDIAGVPFVGVAIGF